MEKLNILLLLGKRNIFFSQINQIFSVSAIRMQRTLCMDQLYRIYNTQIPISHSIKLQIIHPRTLHPSINLFRIVILNDISPKKTKNKQKIPKKNSKNREILLKIVGGLLIGREKTSFFLELELTLEIVGFIYKFYMS